MSIRQIDPSFHVTGQISPDQIKQVADLGYKAVVCMRPDNEGFNQPAFADMEKAAKAAGLPVHYIPVIPGQISQDQAKALKSVITKTEGPVLAYCASGNRCASAYEMAKRA